MTSQICAIYGVYLYSPSKSDRMLVLQIKHECPHTLHVRLSIRLVNKISDVDYEEANVAWMEMVNDSESDFRRKLHTK